MSVKKVKWKNFFYNQVLKGQNHFFNAPRSASIVKAFVDKQYTVHTGNSFVEVLVTKEMTRQKFGEFAPTRKKHTFKKKKKKTKK